MSYNIVDGDQTIQEGIAYLELKGFNTKKQNSDSVLVSKNGDPMLLVWWVATDRFGNSETVYDYISSASNIKFKRDNLENALHFPKGSNIWKEEEQRFQLFMLHERTVCCAVIKKETYNGKVSPKISRYLPLEFLRALYEEKNGNEQKQASVPTGVPSSVNTVLDPKDEDFDGIPF